MDELVKERFKWVRNSATFERICRRFNLGSKRVLDLGCSFGEFLVSFGPGSVGVTSTPAESTHGKDNGLAIVQGNVEELEKIDLGKTFEVIWANNLFEHLLSPHAFLIKLKTVSDPDTLLILGVPVIPTPSWLTRISKFRGALASPHINFFNKKTLRLTVERAGWKIIETRPFVFTNKFIDNIFSSLAPHLYVVAINDQTFHYPEKKLKEWVGEKYYQDIINIVANQTPKQI